MKEELSDNGTRICKWERVESYSFEPSEVASNLRVLKIKVRNRDGFHFWTFDPNKVSETHIAQVFEEQMNQP